MNNPSLYILSLCIGVFSISATLFVSWLARRDSGTRGSAIDTARLAEVERRVSNLESDKVSKSDFQNLSQRLDEIRQDIREIRNGLEQARK